MPAIDPVIVRLIADTKAYNSEISRAAVQTEQSLSRIEAAGVAIGSSARAGLAAVGAAAVAVVTALSVSSIVDATKAGLDYAASLGETAQQLGVTTKFLQEFRFAAKQNGASLEGADNALGKFSVTLGNAFNGKKQAVDAVTLALKGTGTTLAELAKLSDSARYEKLADGISKIEDPAQRAAAKLGIFGKGFKEVGALLDGGAAAFRNAAREAEKFGLILSNGQIQNADEVADKIEKLNDALSARIAGVVADNALAIGQLAEALAQVAQYAVKAGQQFIGFANIARSKGFASALATFNGNDLIAASTPKGAGNLARDMIRKERGPNKYLQDSLRAELKRDPSGAGANVRYLTAELNKSNARLRTGREMLAGAASSSRIIADVPKVVGADIVPVADGAGGGASGPSAAERNRKALEVLARYNEDLGRAQSDLLSALESMTPEVIEQAAFQRERLENDRKAEVARVKNDADLSAAQKATLIAEINKRNAVAADAINRRENEALAKEAAAVFRSMLDNQADILQSELVLATTAAQRRDISLRILDIQYDRERAELDAVIASKESTQTERDIAEARKAVLDKIKKNDVERTRRDTAGPLERYRRDLDDVGKINEDMERVAVDGLQSFNDGITDAIVNGKNLGDVFKNVANQIIADLIRIAVQQAIIKPLASALFGGGDDGGGGGLFGAIGGLLGGLGKGTILVPGRASGGYVGPGQTVRVNEQRGGMELLRMGSQGGTVIPLGAVNATAAQPAASSPGSVLVRLSLSEDIDARIVRTSGPVAVEVLRAGAPSIVDAAEQQTLANANRFRI